MGSISYSSGSGSSISRSSSSNRTTETSSPLKQYITLLQTYEQNVKKINQLKKDLEKAQEELYGIDSKIKVAFDNLDPDTKRLIISTFGIADVEQTQQDPGMTLGKRPKKY